MLHCFYSSSTQLLAHRNAESKRIHSTNDCQSKSAALKLSLGTHHALFSRASSEGMKTRQWFHSSSVSNMPKVLKEAGQPGFHTNRVKQRNQCRDSKSSDTHFKVTNEVKITWYSFESKQNFKANKNSNKTHSSTSQNTNLEIYVEYTLF